MLSIFGYHHSYIVILGRHYVVKIWSLDIALSNTTQLAVCEVVTALISLQTLLIIIEVSCYYGPH